ncbi:class I SAM-dependent methyltransferase [Anaerosinus massiliensis]|uniref:class I SAM-dependent methyltransferase n=1 Tax=Massilibacillus massiliensis TaxID=1806837 RepID=UPI000AAD1E2E|nr:methyltransferase domain-containing protein [Massilibacillus massiliensis]
MAFIDVIAYQIVIIRPLGYQHSDAFQEIAVTLKYGLERLGYKSIITENDFSEDNVNIILGFHLVSAELLPKVPETSIIYNLEQFDQNSMLNEKKLPLFKMFIIWDYSKRNIEIFKKMGCKNPLYYVPIGYVPELTSIQSVAVQDIDVLFYGSMNARREKILQELERRGLHVITLFGVYGKERDTFIARAKVILNIHYYDANIFEIVRISYLLSNRKAVVAECSEDTEIEDDLKEAVALIPYEKLVETCVELVKNDEKRHALETNGFQSFCVRREEDILRNVIKERIFVENNIEQLQVPRMINLGSGKDWRKEYLNVDINHAWHPDIIADISHDFPVNQEIETKRFGTIPIEEGSFDEIIASHLLEHIRDLVSAMTMCLRLLKVGGVFKIHVPYDLSCGAWQDPTHVRAFNEKSWLYYTDWSWYIGWKEARFDLVQNLFILNSVGLEMQANQASLAEILARPRAVDEMQVVLRKRLLTEEEKASVYYRNL